jgi:large repetitive protein
MRHFTYISTATNRAQIVARNLSEILFFNHIKAKIPQRALAWSLFLSVAFLTIATSLSAQTTPNSCGAAAELAQQRYWFFGTKAGLDFGTTGTAPVNSAINTVNLSEEGIVTATNSSGVLQFFAGPTAVYNSTGAVMANGASLLGSSSATQAAVAFQRPGYPKNYFLVTNLANVGSAANGNLYYHRIDMTQNTGLGAVTSKNTLLGTANTASEALAAVPNHNGTKAWVLSVKNSSNQILAYEFDGDGPTGVVVTSTVSSNNGPWFGNLRFSADMSKVVQLSNFNQPTAWGISLVRLFDFNAQTGQLTENWTMTIPTTSVGSGYGVDFSPNGNYIYVTGIGNGAIFQYDLSSNTGAGVLASGVKIGTGAYGNIRRAPDGKMYVANNNLGTISVINSPNTAGIGADFVLNGQALASGQLSQLGLPEMVQGCTVALTDSDTDGIPDVDDLDDDNDGILDTVENAACAVLLPPTNVGTKAIITVPEGWTIATSSPDLVDVAGSPYGVWNIGCTNTAPAAPNGHTKFVFISSPTSESFKTSVNNLIVGKTYQLTYYQGNFGGFNFGPGEVTVKLGTTIIDQFTPVQGCGWSTRVVTFTASAISQDLSFTATGAGSKSAIISVSEDAISAGDCDTDGDGIPDRLDLDSDGDGCPDAIEGGASFTTANLVTSTMAGGNSGAGYTGTSTSPVTQNLGNTVGSTVNALGVPTVAVTGQTIGYSQNGSINACTDTDTDGIPDIDDLDDDNDGILDTAENCTLPSVTLASTYSSTSGNYAVVDGVVENNTKGGTVKISTARVSGATEVFETPIRSIATGNCSTNPAQDSGVMDITFSKSVTNAVFMTYGLEHINEYQDFEILAPYSGTPEFKILNSTLGATLIKLSDTKYRLKSGASCGIYANCSSSLTFQITGAFYTKIRLSGDDPVANSSCRASKIGLDDASTNECNADIDGDGIPNHLDLDSDGDGCFDAIEGGAAFTTSNTTSTGALSGSVSSATATLGVPTSAGTGQTIGSSQNAGIQDANCPQPDYDGDGVPDSTDLDDDNDGILDTAENCTLPNATLASTYSRTSGNYAVVDGVFENNTRGGTVKISTARVSGTTGLFETPIRSIATGNCDGNSAQDSGVMDITFSKSVTNVVFMTDGLEFINEYQDFEILAPYSGIPEFKILNSTFGATLIKLSDTKYRLKSGASCGVNANCPSSLTFQITGAFYSKIRLSGDDPVANSSCRFSKIGLDDASTNECDTDTDNDGIPNHLDLDSDGDGCPDAIEGGASFKSANLVTSTMAGGNSGAGYTGTSTSPVTQNLGNTVGSTATTLGVPTIAGTGQSIGYSQNGAINACLDTDNDGIPDIDDLDDDNDGILDTAENCTLPNATLASTYSRTSGNYAFVDGIVENATKNGTVKIVTTAVSGSSGVAGNPLKQIATGTCDSSPALDTGVRDVTFSKEITNPVFFVYGLEFANEYQDIEILAPYTGIPQIKILEIFSGATIQQLAVNKFRIKSGVSCGSSSICTSSVVFQISGVFFSKLRISGDDPVQTSSCRLTQIGLDDATTTECNADIDGDGIPNHLDLDSDGDGCPDAIEGGGSFTAANTAANGALSGAVSNAAATFGVPISAGTGQSIGSSQNAGVKDAACFTCPTITNTAGDNTNPSACGTATGSVKICGLTANASGYTVNYDKNGTAATALTNQTADASGCITITGLTAGSYTNIKISGTSCPSGGNALSASLTDPTGPSAPTGLAGVPSSGICVGTSVALSAIGTTGATYTWTVSPTGATLASVAGTVSGTTASNTFNSTVAGTYTVSLTQTISGCTSASATTTITVNATPSTVVPTATSKSNVCPTTTVDLTTLQPAAVSGVTYEWHTVASNPTSGTLVASAAAAASGTYYLYGKSASGCYSAASSAVTATVNACIPCTPVDPGIVSGSAASIKTGNTASFTLTGATAGTTTTWAIFPSNGVSPNAGTGTSTGLVTFNIAGDYQVLFSTKNSNTPVGCSEPSFATATGQFTVEAPLSPCAKPSASSVGVNPTSAAISEGATASFTMSGGTPNSSVQWVIIPSTGVSPSSGTGTSTGSVTFATKGLYTAVFSIVNLGDGSCAPVQQSSSAPIAVGLSPCSPPTSILVNSSTANQASNIGESVTFTATGGIPGVRTWTVTPATGASPSSGTGSTATITFTNGGIYSVVFTSKNSTIPLGCTQPVNTSASIIHNVICSKPVLTVQNITCSGTGSGYTVTFSSNATVTTNNGTVSGNTVTVSSGNATLTATTSCGEVTSMVITAPSCPVPATCTQVPSLSVGNALCTGTGTYTVSFSATNGTVTSSVGTVSGNAVINIPVGTNAVLTITPTSAACSGQSVTVTSPVSCAAPSCSDGSLGISFSTVCNNNGTYNINYTTSIAGTTVTSSANSFANLTGTVTLTVTKPGCSPQSVVVSAPVCVLCSKPVLTVQNITCSGTGSGYTVTFSSNATVTTNNGSISGNTVTVSSGNATLTATTSCGEVTSLVVTAPSCPVPATCTQVPSLSVGNALCTGTGTYTVSFSATNGTVTSSAGTVSGNTVINIPVGTNAVLTITPTSASCSGQSITVTSPVSCAAPSCSDGSVGISYSTVCNNNGTYNINYTTSIAGTNVTSSANSFANLTGTVTLTVTKPGCSPQSVVVSAPVCVLCSKPVLTVQNITCSGTGSGYTVTFSSNATVTTNNGTVSGNTVTVSSGNATLTATTSCGEVTSLVITAPSCPVPAACTQVPNLSVGNALCTGTGTYTVSFSATNGTVTSSAGTVSGNTVINIPVGTNAVLTITPSSTACNSQSITVTSPVSCATPSCTDGSVGISFSTSCNIGGTYNINYTTSIAGTNVTSSANSFANLTGTVTLTVTKPGCSPQSVVVSAPACVVNTDVKLQLKVFLQGAFFSPSGASDALMRDNLRTLGVIPNTEPYTAMANSRFTKFSDAGGQSIGAGVLTNTGNDAIVDWVFVELRDAANPATILKTRAALVQRDGDVVEASDGITPVTFTGAVGTSYYVSVKHRNHLGAMTATAISMSGTGTIVDFTTMNSAQLWDKGLVLSDGTLGSYNGSEQVTLGNGKMGLWAGNARNADNKVKYIGSTPDPASLLSQVITFSNNTGGVYNYDFVTPVYMTGDINMDGKVKYAGTSTDTAYILFNIINKYPNNLVNKSYNFDFMIEQIP